MISKKSSQNIDELIQRITFIAKNRCSLSDKDRALLLTAADNLKKFKQQKRLTRVSQLLLIVKACELLSKFFL